MRQNAIRDYFMSKCKPDKSPRDFRNAVCLFCTSTNGSQQNIILKEGDHIVTDVPELCELSMNLFSTLANLIGQLDEININNRYFFLNVLN